IPERAGDLPRRARKILLSPALTAFQNANGTPSRSKTTCINRTAKSRADHHNVINFLHAVYSDTRVLNTSLPWAILPPLDLALEIDRHVLGLPWRPHRSTPGRSRCIDEFDESAREKGLGLSHSTVHHIW